MPALAERTGVTPYHPEHIAERYGLFTVIVLGESVTAVVIAIEAGIHESEYKAGPLGLAAAGIVILFAMWWVYFDKSAAGMLRTLNSSLLWGYGHYLIFASIAAVGAGLNVGTEYDLGAIHISRTLAGFALTIPVAVFLVVVWALHLRHRHTRLASGVLPDRGPSGAGVHVHRKSGCGHCRRARAAGDHHGRHLARSRNAVRSAGLAAELVSVSLHCAGKEWNVDLGRGMEPGSSAGLTVFTRLPVCKPGSGSSWSCWSSWCCS